MKGVAIVILVISEARGIELNHGFLGLTDDSVPQMSINELNDSDRKVWGQAFRAIRLEKRGVRNRWRDIGRRDHYQSLGY